MIQLNAALRIIIFFALITCAKGEESLFIKRHKVEDIKKYLLTPHDENVFQQIKEQITAKDWKSAKLLAKNIKSESYRKAIEVYIQVKRFKVVFRITKKEVLELIEFNSQNSFLREFELFNRRIEFYYLNNIVNFSDVSAYFNRFRSRDTNVMIKLLRDEEAKIGATDSAEPKQLANLRESLNRKIRDTWIRSDFSVDDQEIFLNSFTDRIGEKDIIEKAELLVFKWQPKHLSGLLPMIINDKYRALFSSIVKMEDYPNSLDDILKNVPRNLLDNEALLFTEVKYFESSGLSDEILDILKKFTKKLKHGEFWQGIIASRTRELIRAKKYREAYEIANSYNNLGGDRTNLLWLSGWLALRYLKNYDSAQKHFKDLYGHVAQPTNRARAAYWLGRTAEENNDGDNALKWYRISSEYPLTFYGQLAIQRINDMVAETGETKTTAILLPTAPKVTQTDMLNLKKNWMVKYALLCHNYENKKDEARNIFMALLFTVLKTEGEIGGLIRILEGLGNDQLTFAVSVEATRKMVFAMDNIFPVMKFPKKSENMALIHAMAKKESNFVKYAESIKMAKGLMQIIPSTAKEACNGLNIKYNGYRLKSDAEYNVKIADYYIGQLSRKFRGSKVLVAAAYNAGPGTVGRWLEDFGDPRDKDIKFVIDWIESIGSVETREYVQRVLEALLVYEIIFSREK